MSFYFIVYNTDCLCSSATEILQTIVILLISVSLYIDVLVICHVNYQRIVIQGNHSAQKLFIFKLLFV